MNLTQAAAALRNSIDALQSDVSAVLEAEDPLAAAVQVHDASDRINHIRTQFANMKGLAVLLANEDGNSYPRIAETLSCSEPYVQQMVYRGRRVRAKKAGR